MYEMVQNNNELFIGLMNCTSSVQIIGRLTFTNPNITAHLIQQNIVQTYSNLSHY
jgi:hypothetical protein